VEISDVCTAGLGLNRIEDIRITAENIASYYNSIRPTWIKGWDRVEVYTIAMKSFYQRQAQKVLWTRKEVHATVDTAGHCTHAEMTSGHALGMLLQLLCVPPFGSVLIN